MTCSVMLVLSLHVPVVVHPHGILLFQHALVDARASIQFFVLAVELVHAFIHNAIPWNMVRQRSERMRRLFLFSIVIATTFHVTKLDLTAASMNFESVCIILPSTACVAGAGAVRPGRLRGCHCDAEGKTVTLCNAA